MELWPQRAHFCFAFKLPPLNFLLDFFPTLAADPLAKIPLRLLAFHKIAQSMMACCRFCCRPSIVGVGTLCLVSDQFWFYKFWALPYLLQCRLFRPEATESPNPKKVKIANIPKRSRIVTASLLTEK